MPLPEDTNARVFYRVAKQRLEDAAILFGAGKYNSAVYLAGYSIECMWKALIIEATPRNKRSERARSYRGARGHNFEWLREQYRHAGMPPFPDDFNRSMILVSEWEISLRYRPEIGDRSDAQRFLREAERVIDAIDRRL